VGRPDEIETIKISDRDELKKMAIRLRFYLFVSRLAQLIGSQVYNWQQKRIDRAKEVNEELIRRGYSIAFPHISLECI
jgi:hypothetical protein